MHSIKAAELFMEGFNCAQAVFAAFEDVTGINKTDATKLASGFGGGIGGIREVCGAFNGIVMVYNCLYGYIDPSSAEEKSRVYSDIQALADCFKTKVGNLICREILKNGIDTSDMNDIEKTYCEKRPCAKLVITASKILDEFIDNNPIRMS